MCQLLLQMHAPRVPAETAAAAAAALSAVAATPDCANLLQLRMWAERRQSGNDDSFLFAAQAKHEGHGV